MRKDEPKKKGGKPVPIEPSSGNVFADLGLKDPEELLAKAALVQRIADIIAERKLTQVGAAKLSASTSRRSPHSCAASSMGSRRTDCSGS